MLIINFAIFDSGEKVSSTEQIRRSEGQGKARYGEHWRTSHGYDQQVGRKIARFYRRIPFIIRKGRTIGG